MADIFESPDGGHTVYRRQEGSTERHLHHVSAQRQQQLADLRQTQLWSRIHRAAKNDPALNHMLEQAEIYYHLKYSP